MATYAKPARIRRGSWSDRRSGVSRNQRRIGTKCARRNRCRGKLR